MLMWRVCLLHKVAFPRCLLYNWVEKKLGEVSKLHRRKYLIGGIVVCIAAGIILFNGLRSCSVSSYTVSELLDKGEEVYGKTVRVDGEVATGSVLRDNESLRLDFLLLDENNIDSIPVVHIGAEPDNFHEGRGVTIEGRLLLDGIFEADDIFTKCASKYVPEE